MQVKSSRGQTGPLRGYGSLGGREGERGRTEGKKGVGGRRRERERGRK